MNDPIEDALNRLKPAEMPNDLMARLSAARSLIANPGAKEAPARQPGFLARWLLPLGVCAAAAAATVAALQFSGDKPVEPGPVASASESAPAVPFEREDRFVGAREVGLIVPPNQPPIRLMEVEWMEADTLHSGPNGHGVRVETRRRGVVPMTLEVY